MNKNDIVNLTNRVYALTLLFPKKEPLRWKLREAAADVLAASARQDCDELPVDDLEAMDCFFEVAKEQKWVKEAELLSIQQEYVNLRGQNCSFQDDLLCLRQEVVEPSIEPIMLFPVPLSGTEAPLSGAPESTELEPESVIEEEAEPELEMEAEPVDAEPVEEEKEPSPLGGAAARNGLNPRQGKILGIIKERERVQVGEVKDAFPTVDKRTLRRDFRSLLEQGFIERLGQKNDTFYRLKVS